MKKCGIVVPIHNETMNMDEKESLIQLKQILGGYDIILVYPDGLNIDSYKSIIENIISLPFPNEYFKDRMSYCKMCCDINFYEKFLDYEYILIYQLDCWVFKNELDYWCEKGYDYIGAPFFIDWFVKRNKMVGNGGFSLRKVRSIIKYLEVNNDTTLPHFNTDDGFYAANYNDILNIPDANEAALFSLETFPSQLYSNTQTLPFGCHAFKKYDYEFWRKYINLKGKDEKDNRVLLCCIGKNENRYVREFVKHYKKLGVTNIILYDNNDINGEKFEDAIGDYINSGYVKLVNYRGKKACQLEAYADCYNTNTNAYDWIIFVDLDEYITLVKHNNIQEYLSQEKFSKYSIIKLNWLCYGDNELVEYEDKPLQERFVNPADINIKVYYDFPQNYTTKAIVRGGISELKWGDPHIPYANVAYCNSEGREDTIGFATPMTYNEAFIKHYVTKSASEFLRKMKQGTPDRMHSLKYKEQLKKFFFSYNKWTQEKEDILNMGMDDVLKTLVCCIGKNENRYIKEYVEWYKQIGVTHIRIYDNNDIDGEHFEEVIKDYIDNGYVDIVDYRGREVCQLESYKECYDELGKEYDWILFIDCGDEFLTLLTDETIDQYLSSEAFKDFDMIHLNLMTFGDNGLVKYEDKPLTERFPQPLPFETKIAYDFPENAHISSIVRGGLEELKWEGTPHTPFPNSLRCCDDIGTPVNSKSPFSNISFRRAFFRHYCLKTAEEYCNKMRRGFPDQKWDGRLIQHLVETRFFRGNEVTEEKVEIFKRELGIDMSYLLPHKFDGVKNKDIQIYSLCYDKKKFAFMDDEVVTPLQVGAANGTDVCELKDNTGDNISDKNYFYIENTGTYWIWKNIKDAKYKGQMQYRRPLEGVNGKTNFEDIFSKYKVITCEPFHHPSHKTPTEEQPMVIIADTVEQGYAFSNCIDDLYILEMVVDLFYPEYKESYKKYIKEGPNLYYSNGFIMKSEDYDRYCEFLFGCLEKYQQFVDVSTPQRLMERVQYNMTVGKYPKHMHPQMQTPEAIRWQMSIGGFLSERIWTLWLLHNFKEEEIYKTPYVKMEEGMYT